MIGILCSLVSFIYITFIKTAFKNMMIRLMRLVATVYLGSILVGFFATAKVNSNIHENGTIFMAPDGTYWESNLG